MSDLDYQEAELALSKMLAKASIDEKPAYRTREVIAIFDISEYTLKSLCDAYVPNTKHGIESYTFGRRRRIPHHAMVEYLARSSADD